MKETTTNNEIDSALRSYFQREMPQPWPKAPVTETTTASETSPAWVMASSRMIVGVAAVAVVLIYLGLSTFFPKVSSGGLDPNAGPNIAHRPGITKTLAK